MAAARKGRAIAASFRPARLVILGLAVVASVLEVGIRLTAGRPTVP
jgi:hypothetical protein